MSVTVEQRSYRSGAVAACRALSVAAVVAAAAQVALSVADGHHLQLTVGVLQVVFFTVTGWVWWRRPPQTVIDLERLHVRRSPGRRAPRIGWADVVAVRPQASGQPVATAHLRDGQTWILPGVPQHVAWRLARPASSPVQPSPE